MDRKSWGGRNRRRYHAAMSWSGDEGSFITMTVRERPILNVFSGSALFGDIRVDAYHPWPDVRADGCYLPFRDDSFGCVFMDPPWGLEAMRAMSIAMHEGLRVATVLYVYSPVLWGSSRGRLTHAWLRCLPGLNHPAMVARYERPNGAAERESGVSGVEPRGQRDDSRLGDSPVRLAAAKSAACPNMSKPEEGT